MSAQHLIYSDCFLCQRYKKKKCLFNFKWVSRATKKNSTSCAVQWFSPGTIAMLQWQNFWFEVSLRSLRTPRLLRRTMCLKYGFSWKNRAKLFFVTLGLEEYLEVFLCYFKNLNKSTKKAFKNLGKAFVLHFSLSNTNSIFEQDKFNIWTGRILKMLRRLSKIKKP